MSFLKEDAFESYILDVGQLLAVNTVRSPRDDGARKEPFPGVSRMPGTGPRSSGHCLLHSSRHRRRAGAVPHLADEEAKTDSPPHLRK